MTIKNEKKCSKCGNEKPATLEYFSRDRRRKENGLTPACKDCQKEYRQKNRDRTVKYLRNYYQENKEEMNEKGRQYYKDNKEWVDEKNKQWREENKDYVKQYNDLYYLENKEEIKQRVREYSKNNKEKIYQYKQEYRQRPEVKERRNQQDSTRRKEDPVYKIRSSVSRSVNRAIKRNGSRKEGSILKHLPYSINELKEHLENQFEDWMNWSNYGSANTYNKRWNIEHIVAHSKFHYDSMKHPNFRKCWALKNLRPMDARENSSKGNR